MPRKPSRPPPSEALLRGRRSAMGPGLTLGALALLALALALQTGTRDPAPPPRFPGRVHAGDGPAAPLPRIVPPPEIADEEDIAPPPPEVDSIGPAMGALGWWKVNTHAHASTAGAFTARDDGLLPVSYWLDRYAVKGFDLLFFTPHSHKNPGAAGRDRWLKTREALPKMRAPLVVAVGAEVGVPKGPAWRAFASADFVGNVHHHLNHIVVLGAKEFIGPGLGAKEVATLAHEGGGVAILAHPEIWEPGYWDAPETGIALDGLEVYNGLLMSVTDRDNAPLYRHAVSYGGLGMKLAAIGGSDTHKKKAAASTATWFAAVSPDPDLFVDAVRARKTFATTGFDDLRVECDKMGEVRHEPEVTLSIQLDRVVDTIVLWREESEAFTWVNVASAEFSETLTAAAAYSWEVRDGDARGYSSAVWYEPLRAEAGGAGHHAERAAP
jgi:hypothetical protein